MNWVRGMVASSGWLGVDATQTPLRTGRRKPWRGLSHPMARSLDGVSAEIPAYLGGERHHISPA